MATNKVYRTLDTIVPRFWRDLQIRYDALHDINDKEEQFKSALASLGATELAELANMFSLPIAEGNKEQLIAALTTIDADDKLLLCLLREFTNRRKPTITQYYDQHAKEKIYETPLTQLYALFKESPAYLYEIYTYHMWKVRGSGALLSSEAEPKKVQQSKVVQIALEQSFQDKLCDILFKKSGEKNFYRVFSYAQFSNRVIFLLYKQVNDTSILDFKENVRNQEVSILLFQINWDEQTLELKSVNISEINGIKQHAEETFGTVLTPFKTDVFRDYNVVDFKDAVLKGTTASGKPVDNFLIDRITFRGSPLKNAPEVTLELKDMDIWPSVMDAHEKNAVNIKSLKDIAYLSLHSANTTRTIRSIVKDNSNIVFTMDDSRMDAAVKEKISQKFMEKFGVPLFQEITNEKFVAGKADLVDYVMAQSSPDAIREPEEEQTMLHLQQTGLLSLEVEYVVECLNEECGHQERVSNADMTLDICPHCLENKFRTKILRSVQSKLKNVTGAIKNQLEHLCVDEEWIVLKETTRKYNTNQYQLHNYERRRDGKILQVLITEQIIPNRVVQQFIKQMTPLFVVFVGKQEKYIDSYSQDCLQAMTFGEVYALEPSSAKVHFNKLFADLELRSKNYMASAAYKANVSVVKNIGLEPSKTSEDYNDTEFEDDVYCMLKDLFVNTAKWGQEMKGKAVPEGMFSISFRKKKGNKLDSFKYAFSFDCKLTRKDEGYELGKSEQRKAIEYVNTLNQSDYLASYASDNQLTSHVFISNKVRQSQVDGMIRYFREQLGNDFMAVPAFLPSETLIHLHSLYRKYYDQLLQAPNIFMSGLYELFRSPGFVTTEAVDGIFEKALDPNLREIEFLEMRKLTNDITD